jgi:sarcosine oxidase
MTMDYDTLVIGAGLFGAAAGKHLSAAGGRVGILGVSEPQDVQAHDGVFASHYDQGRLFGIFARGALWSRLAALSIDAFADIAAASGVPFYAPVGRLHMPTTYLRGGGYVAETEAAHGLDVWHVTAAEAAAALPYLHFPGATAGYWERGRAGYLNPRLLVQAQLALAQAQGATLIRAQATAVSAHGDGLRVTTADGSSLTAGKVLLATGAFTNCFDLLPEKLPLLAKTETILLAEVPESEVARLRDMPSVDYGIESDVLEGIYMTPPLRYPDGRFYIKMGANAAADQYLDTFEQIASWFKTGDSDVMLEPLRRAFRALLPDVRVLSWQTGRCIITYTTRRNPYIDELLPGRLFVAVGGNGNGAKVSDGVGRLAADLLLGRPWPAGFPRADFAAGPEAIEMPERPWD